MLGNIRIWIFWVLNFAVIVLMIAVALIISDISSWRSEVIPTIHDSQHAPFITSNYTTLPAIHLVISFLVISISVLILIKIRNALTTLAIAIGFIIYLTDVVLIPILFALVLPSTKFEGCYNRFTQPGVISNNQAAHICHLLTGPLYGVTIAGLCIMAIIVLMWIPLLSDGRPTSYPPLPTIPPTQFPIGVELDARAESNPGNTATTDNKGSENDITIPADQLVAPTISPNVDVPSEKDNPDDIEVQDGAG